MNIKDSKPDKREQRDCLIDGTTACALIRDLSLNALVDDTIGHHNEIRRKAIQTAYGNICLVQKRCNTFIHHPQLRDGYPCSKVRNELKIVIDSGQRILRRP